MFGELLMFVWCCRLILATFSSPAAWRCPSRGCCQSSRDSPTVSDQATSVSWTPRHSTFPTYTTMGQGQMRTSGLVMAQNPAHWASRCPVKWAGESVLPTFTIKMYEFSQSQISLLTFSDFIPLRKGLDTSIILSLPELTPNDRLRVVSLRAQLRLCVSSVLWFWMQN